MSIYKINISDYENSKPVNISAHSYRMNKCPYFHCHDFYEFEYIISGHGIHYVNNYRYEVHPGDFWGLGLEDFHRYEDCDVEIQNLIIVPSHASDEIINLFQNQKFPLHGNIPRQRRQTVENIFDYTQETCHSNNVHRDKRMSGATLALLTEYLEYAIKAEDDVHGQNTHKYVHSAMQFILNHFYEPISLKDIATALNLSADYLSHIFSAYMGCHFMEYLNQVRVQNACNLLLDGQDSITEIAHKSGFGSISNLNRNFKRYHHMTPTMFRKKANDQNN